MRSTLLSAMLLSSCWKWGWRRWHSLDNGIQERRQVGPVWSAAF